MGGFRSGPRMCLPRLQHATPSPGHSSVPQPYLQAARSPQKWRSVTGGFRARPRARLGAGMARLGRPRLPPRGGRTKAASSSLPALLLSPLLELLSSPLLEPLSSPLLELP